MPIRPCHYFPDDECYESLNIRIRCEMAISNFRNTKPVCDHLTEEE